MQVRVAALGFQCTKSIFRGQTQSTVPDIEEKFDKDLFLPRL